MSLTSSDELLFETLKCSLSSAGIYNPHNATTLTSHVNTIEKIYTKSVKGYLDCKRVLKLLIMFISPYNYYILLLGALS